MSKGELVTVKLYGGKTAVRRVVAVKSKVIVICSEEEYVTAEREGREPSGLGFPREDILENLPARKDVRSQSDPRKSSSMAGD